MFKPPRPVGMAVNLAPMVDVMMCLIIFFLLASKIIDAEHQPVDLAFAVAAQEVDRNELGSRVTINVRPGRSGDPNDADYVVVDFDGTNITERVLEPEGVNRHLHTRAEKARARGEELRCVIRADKGVMYKHVEVVLRGAGLAKIAKIVFSTKKGLDPEGEI
jgi:biopolymer transport protein ExbD